MKTTTSYLGLCLSMYTCLFWLASSPAMAQQDTVEFKLIPKYYPEQDADVITIPPPEIIFKPDIVFPNDPNLQGREAKVFVNVLVNTNGVVHEAKVLKSTDDAFDKYALKYARQYKFKFTEEAIRRIDTTSSVKKVWITFPIRFKR